MTFLNHLRHVVPETSHQVGGLTYKEAVAGGSDLAPAPAHDRDPYHCLVPDDRHPLFHPIGALRDGCEVVLPNRLLGGAESAVGTPRELQVSTGKGKKLRVNWRGGLKAPLGTSLECLMSAFRRTRLEFRILSVLLTSCVSVSEFFPSLALTVSPCGKRGGGVRSSLGNKIKGTQMSDGTDPTCPGGGGEQPPMSLPLISVRCCSK